jgi:hypothetical protein
MNGMMLSMRSGEPDAELETTEEEIDNMIGSGIEVEVRGPSPANGAFVRPIPAYGGVTKPIPTPGLTAMFIKRYPNLPIAGTIDNSD